jgi:hypothetical protein
LLGSAGALLSGAWDSTEQTGDQRELCREANAEWHLRRRGRVAIEQACMLAARVLANGAKVSLIQLVVLQGVRQRGARAGITFRAATVELLQQPARVHTTDGER